MKTSLIFFLSALLSFNAFAHSKLQSSSPAKGAVLTSAPTQIELKFGAAIRLTKVSVENESGVNVKLIKSVPTELKKDFLLPANIESKGKHTLKWRGLGEDGHAMKGSFSFEIR